VLQAYVRDADLFGDHAGAKAFGLLDRRRGRQLKLLNHSAVMSTTIPPNCRQLSSCGHSWPETEAGPPASVPGFGGLA
jgi:hypothetical protein